MLISEIQARQQEFSPNSLMMPERILDITIRGLKGKDLEALVMAIGEDIQLIEVKPREFALLVFTKEEI